MRLPWPFGRAQRSPSGGGDAPEGGDSARAGDGPSGSPGGSPARASGSAWRDLPPLAETVGPPPLVAPNRPFAAALATSEPAAPILAPLSHGRSLEAPRGIVSGIARPTSTVSGPPLPAPVQRSPLRRHGAGPEDMEPSEGVADEPPAAIPAPATPPVAHLPTLPAAPTPRRMLTSAPEPARPAPIVGLVGQPRAPGGPRGPIATPAPDTAPGTQRAPAVPPPAPSPVSPAAPATTLASPEPAPAAPRLTIGQARRLGLGAPVAGGPIGAMTFRGGPTPAATSASPAVLSPASAHTGSHPSTTTSSGIQRAPADTTDLPLAKAGAASGAGAMVEEPEGVSPSIPAAGPAAASVAARPLGGVQRSPMLAEGAPILAAKPLRAGIQRAPLVLTQRAPDEAEVGPGPASTPAPLSVNGPVKIHRGGAAGDLSKAVDARSFTHGGEIFMPSSHGPLTSGTGKALLAHELTHVVQQRRLGTSLPAEGTSQGRSLEAEAVAAERSSKMPLAMPGLDGDREEPAAPAPGVQRAPLAEYPGMRTEPANQDGTSDSQRAYTSESQPTDGSKAGRSTPKTGAGAGGGGRGGGHSHTEQELEVLAHQLYHRIGRHLRRELLVDRERVGFALDLP